MYNRIKKYGSTNKVAKLNWKLMKLFTAAYDIIYELNLNFIL